MNKKKIGIITFHSSHNCGSMLQAYALQTVLEKRYGAEVEIIDFSNKGSRNLYGLFDFRLKKSALRHNLLTIRHWKLVNQYRRDYINFKEKYLHTTEHQFRNHKELESLNGKYDVIIAGGDQVWNVLCPDADDAYFLDFIHGSKKAAYSPSLGGNNLNEVVKDTQKYRRLLNEFDFISVREPNGKKWLEQLIGREVPIIADPTLLLSHEEWLQSFSIPQMDEKFIFNYAFFHNRPEANAAIQKISEEMGMPVYVLDNKSWAAYRLDKYGIKRYKMTGPIAFLTLMENAEWVLTQSFHGTLFSAMFHKNFWSYRAPSVNKPGDDRAIAILKQLGLADRYQVIDDLPNQNFTKTIDYANTDALISKLRSDAFSYLDKIMNSI